MLLSQNAWYQHPNILALYTSIACLPRMHRFVYVGHKGGAELALLVSSDGGGGCGKRPPVLFRTLLHGGHAFRSKLW